MVSSLPPSLPSPFLSFLAAASSIFLYLRPLRTVLAIQSSKSTDNHGSFHPLASMNLVCTVNSFYALSTNNSAMLFSSFPGALLSAWYIYIYSTWSKARPPFFSLFLYLETALSLGMPLSLYSLPTDNCRQIFGCLLILSSLAFFAAPFSVVTAVLRDKSTRSMPADARLAIANAANTFLWTALGASLGDSIVTFVNGAGCFFSVVQMALWAAYCGGGGDDDGKGGRRLLLAACRRGRALINGGRLLAFVFAIAATLLFASWWSFSNGGELNRPDISMVEADTLFALTMEKTEDGARSKQMNYGKQKRKKKKKEEEEEDGLLRVTHMVVSLDGVPGADKENSGRLDEFRDNWTGVCGELEWNVEFNVCQGGLSKVTGVGLTRAFSTCLQQAYDSGADAIFVYEDDAVPFVAELCDVNFQREIFRASPSDSLVLLLGAHDFVVVPDRVPSPFVKMAQSYGTYGYAVKRDNAPNLIELFRDQAAECEREQRKCSPDVSWFHLAKATEMGVYAVNPLLIDHAKGTYSNTWRKKRSSTNTGEAWMGKRNVYEMINKHPNMNIK